MRSNAELARLRKDLESQRVDKDDLRYEVFNAIYEMLADFIELRFTCNVQLEKILELNTRKLEFTFGGKATADMKAVGSVPGKKVSWMSWGGTTPGAPEEVKSNHASEFERRKNMRKIETPGGIMSMTEGGSKPKKDKSYRVCS